LTGKWSRRGGRIGLRGTTRAMTVECPNDRDAWYYY
jgi:hypothetical protein